MTSINPKWIWALQLLNLLVAGAVFVSSCAAPFPDGFSYIQMAKGLLVGRFSSWYFFPEYIPETLRMFGYPFFLSVFLRFCDGDFPVKFVQLGMHFAAIYVALRIIAHRISGNIAQLIFLGLTAINIQVPYYAGQIATETATGFFLILYCYMMMVPPQTGVNGALTGLLAAVVFQLRPGYLYLPFGIAIASIVFPGILKGRWTFIVAKLAIFICLLIPYGLWNKKHHGVFKVTSLAGAASGAHMGYWAFLLPRDYNVNFIWGQFTIPNEFFMFSLYRLTDSERARNAVMFEAEKEAIFSKITPLESDADRKTIDLMERLHPNVFLLHNTAYTMAREKVQARYLLTHIAENPGDYFLARTITFARLWFTGINLTHLKSATSIPAKFKVILPCLITFCFIFLGFLFSTLCFGLRVLDWREWAVPYTIAVYAAGSHSIFPISARYTVPIHLLLLMLVAVAASRLLAHGTKMRVGKELLKRSI